MELLSTWPHSPDPDPRRCELEDKRFPNVCYFKIRTFKRGRTNYSHFHFFIGTRQQMNAMHFGYELSPQYSDQIHSAHFTVRQIE